jgi:hypothetical protein
MHLHKAAYPSELQVREVRNAHDTTPPTFGQMDRSVGIITIDNGSP